MNRPSSRPACMGRAFDGRSRGAARHPPPRRIETLVLSGGGMKGVASLGAVVALRRAGSLRHLTTVVGTSAGALVAAALALDRASPKLLDALASRDSAVVPDDVDLPGLLTTFGLDSGRRLDGWIRELLGGRAYTFAEVRRLHGVRLVVCATDLTARRAAYFGPDSTPDMDVALALRMSCSVPLYFSAVRHEGRLYVDGAVADNFPLDWAGRQFGEAGVLGICFAPRRSDPGASLEAYVGALLECSTGRHRQGDDGKEGKESFETIRTTRSRPGQPGPPTDGRIVRLDVGARSAFDFSMPPDRMRRLYACGARQARAWVKKVA